MARKTKAPTFGQIINEAELAWARAVMTKAPNATELYDRLQALYSEAPAISAYGSSFPTVSLA